MATPEEALDEAYRRGLLPPDRASAYEEAAKRGIVKMSAESAAMRDARNRARSTPGAIRAISNGGSLGFADELDSLSAAAETAVGNTFKRLGGKTPEYDAGQARAAVMQAEREAREQHAKDHPVEDFAENIVGMIPTGRAGVGIIGKGATIGARAARAGAVGAGYGAVAGAGNAEGGLIPRAKGAAVGGVIGAVTGSTLEGAGGLIGARAAAKAAAPPSAARQLAAEGVQLTPGQMAGGAAKVAEDLAMRAPIIGPAISAARKRSVDGLNRAVANRALAPIGETLPDNIATGHDAVEYVANKIGSIYDQAAAKVPLAQIDAVFTQTMGAIKSTASELPPDVRAQFETILKNRLDSRLGQPLDGKAIREIQSELGSLSAKYGSSSDGAQRLLSDHLDEVTQALGDLLGRSSPDAAKLIKGANAGWRQYAVLRRAAASSTDGVATPGQLRTAVRVSDKSVGKGQTAKGKATMQDLSTAASQVLPDSFGNPGTANTLLAAGSVGGLLTHPVATVAAGAGLTVGAGVYSRPVQALINDFYRSGSPGQAERALARLTQMAARNPALRPLEAQLRAELTRQPSGQEQSP